MAINTHPFPVINLPVHHLLLLLWKIIKQVFYNNDLYIHVLVMGIGNIFKIDDRYINIDR
jgi:hypothetical protein